MHTPANMVFSLPVVIYILSLVGACLCDSTLAPTMNITVSSTQPAQTTIAFHPTNSTSKPLATAEAKTTATPTTKEGGRTTKAHSVGRTAGYSTTGVYANTKGAVKSASRLKLNSTSSAVMERYPQRQLVRMGPIDCDLPVLPRKSRLWRGNETHELRLPVTFDMVRVYSRGGPIVTKSGSDDGILEKSREPFKYYRHTYSDFGIFTDTSSICIQKAPFGEVELMMATGTPEACAGEGESCPPTDVSWEGAADIQSGDVLIVRIAEASLLAATAQLKNDSDANTTHDDNVTVHRPPQPAVYQVTRQGHAHCDVSEGMLLDIMPLDVRGAKVIALYDKDLTEGVNLLIVVSVHWGGQCVRLKVTVESDNCGEAQECSKRGVCYTNFAMEGYECQCCAGYAGPHCEERDVCHPSPCLNNGICVDLTQPLNGANYHCLCPFGRKCEKDPCYSAPCLNGGSCMSLAMNGSTTFHCACADGWVGAHCELPTVGGACASKPCANGICIEQTDTDVEGNEYRCFCLPGYTGEHCEVEYNECESSPCAHGGTCTDRVGGFACACPRGYTGNTCQLKVDLCSPGACPPQRYCVDHGNSYSCDCPRGYVGDECHLPVKSACDTNPCAHGGTCWSGLDSSFYCSCRPGYTGKLCEEDFILESVERGGGEAGGAETRGGGARAGRLPLGLYHDRLHNVYIAAGTLGAAIAIVGVVVTACHCRVNKTYSRLLARLARRAPAPAPHWLQDKRAPAPPPPAQPALDTSDMYYTLDFSDSQSSPLIQ